MGSKFPCSDVCRHAVGRWRATTWTSVDELAATLTLCESHRLLHLQLQRRCARVLVGDGAGGHTTACLAACMCHTPVLQDQLRNSDC